MVSLPWTNEYNYGPGTDVHRRFINLPTFIMVGYIIRILPLTLSFVRLSGVWVFRYPNIMEFTGLQPRTASI